MSATVRVRDVASGDIDSLPGPTRTVDMPMDFDDSTGAGVMLRDGGSAVQVSYTAPGGEEVRDMSTVSALSFRAPGSIFLAESNDVDYDGRPMWWATTRI